MKKLKYSAPKSAKKRRNIYWFFRSFIFTTVILFCVLSLVVGISECYVKMENQKNGSAIQIIEIKDGNVFVMGREIF